uniref:Large ribosomal subunit protein uL18 n=2 Tax=environmental samples TaxID=48479 RepID=A0A0H4TF31_9BACT|nr:50S ribosomal protein L18, large subunit ribosomal protein L18 [uncultured bacterium Rifle_16ft_4_minimus_752]AKQ05237.1 50S ribosomal protein L18, large subunit ribosomal protein L18 [uncultured bacterium Rifle_16ft_4_minimus_28965]
MSVIDWSERRRARERRHDRIRKKIFGVPEKPRLSVFKSRRHIYAQIINDLEGRTLVAASTLSPEFKVRAVKGTKAAIAKAVGEILAEKALKADIRRVVFDRGGNKFHGRVKALATGAREKGLTF